ncbi:glycoside hydrolase family 2 protein [Winogradskyella sp. A2]|uniref:glycoside hydrolase family 2 protein n=1 Tax=Winogradskyella sp. A2 TaxID=3366944 RepID=UPI00398C7BF5
MTKTLLLVISILCFCSVFAQEKLMTNAFNREATSLNGYWNYIVDPYENGFYNYRYEPFENQKNPVNGAFFTNSKRKDKSDLIEYDFDKMDSLKVPGDWNSQKEKLFYYEGTLWYKKSFDYNKSNDTNRVFLYFGGSNYKTDVYFNGKKLGQHIGGFTPFQFEITELLKPKQNFVIIKVDNKRIKEGVPTLNTDWWNYGGLTRDIKLIETAETFINDYSIHLNQKNNQQIEGEISLNGSNKINSQVTVEIPELGIKKKFKTDDSGTCKFNFITNRIEYWSPNSPKLYDVILSTNEDRITDNIGFRTIETKGPDILLNGENIFLKGISIHEENPINGGRSNSYEDAEQLLKWAKSLGCNYVRLAHYPHNEYMVRMADKMGILVWEEIPVYWTISWENENTYLNAQNQISEVIDRDKNRASVIIWSMANETPTSNLRTNFLTKLAKFTRNKDKTRLISAALEQQNYNDDPNTRTIADPFADVVDILSFNQYIGWYDGGIEKCKTINWKITHNKPVMISEFGAGAKYGLNGDKDDRWTEEYQEFLYQETLKMIDKIEQLRGVSPWILVDFKSPRRVLPEIQDNFNRKGLISEKGEKKKAFFVLKNYYESKN